MPIRGLFAVVVGWFFSILMFLAFAFINLVTWRKYSGELGALFFNPWGRLMMRLAGVEFILEGREQIMHREGRVAVVNHQSALDMMWVGAVAPPFSTGIGKKEVLYIPIFNLAWWGLRAISIDRSNKFKAVKALQRAAVWVRENRYTLFVAPEGTRTPDGNVGPFKKGAFHLAIQGQLPMVPVIVAGAFDVWPKNKLLCKSGKVKVKVLPKIDTSAWKTETIEAHIEEVRNLMVKAQLELRATL